MFYNNVPTRKFKCMGTPISSAPPLFPQMSDVANSFSLV